MKNTPSKIEAHWNTLNISKFIYSYQRNRDSLSNRESVHLRHILVLTTMKPTVFMICYSYSYRSIFNAFLQRTYFLWETFDFFQKSYDQWENFCLDYKSLTLFLKIKNTVLFFLLLKIGDIENHSSPLLCLQNIQGFKDSRIQKIQGFKDSRIQGFKDSKD